MQKSTRTIKGCANLSLYWTEWHIIGSDLTVLHTCIGKVLYVLYLNLRDNPKVICRSALLLSCSMDVFIKPLVILCL